MTCDVAVEVTLQPLSLELCLGMDIEPTESLWVRIEEQTALGNIMVSICCRTSDQEEEMDEVFKQLKTTSCMQSLALMEKFNPAISAGRATLQCVTIQGSQCQLFDTTGRGPNEKLSAGPHTCQQGETYWECED